MLSLWGTLCLLQTLMVRKLTSVYSILSILSCDKMRYCSIIIVNLLTASQNDDELGSGLQTSETHSSTANVPISAVPVHWFLCVCTLAILQESLSEY